MNASSTENEGFRILDEFVCQAIKDPSAPSAEDLSLLATRSENDGILADVELVADAVPENDQAAANDKEIVRIVCPQCHQRLRTKSRYLGQRGRCCSCGAVFVVVSG